MSRTLPEYTWGRSTAMPATYPPQETRGFPIFRSPSLYGRDGERKTGRVSSAWVRVCQSGRMLFSVHVDVTLRPGIADPQGSTIERSLPTLGFDGVSGVRVGKS